jgi:hypothetical protein
MDYGRFYCSELVRLIRRINKYLIRWVWWKHKRLRSSSAKAKKIFAAVYGREPGGSIELAPVQSGQASGSG